MRRSATTVVVLIWSSVKYLGTSFLQVSPLGRPKVSPCQGLAASSSSQDDSAPNSNDFFAIEPVTSRKRYYDLLAFRYRNTPLKSYMADHPRLSKEDALYRLTWGKCHDDGQDVWFSSANKLGLLKQWAVVLLEDNDKFHGGVIGAVDALLMKKRHAIVVDLRNLRVHDDYRRRGIASHLMDQVLEFAKEEKATAVTLLVDLDNHGARALYEKKGFVADPDNAEKMSWTVPDAAEKS